MYRIVLAASLLMTAAPAIAGATNFSLVNGTGGALSEVAIRRAGSADWKPLNGAPAAGAATAVDFNDPDCAFDIRANVPGGGSTTWAGINLCGAKSVTLRKDEAAGAWVDYDQ